MEAARRIGISAMLKNSEGRRQETAGMQIRLKNSGSRISGMKVLGVLVAVLLALDAIPGAAGDDSVARQLYESRCAFC
jgi:hypothetical protein